MSLCICRVSQQIRSLEKVRKQFDNIKTRSKEKIDEIRHPKTGGGPQIILTDSQRLYAETHGKDPQVVGHPGYDTELPEGTYPSNTFTSDADVVNVPDVPEYINVDDPEEASTSSVHVPLLAETDLKSTQSKSAGKQSKKRKRVDRNDLEEEGLKLEIQRAESELELLKKQMNVAEAQLQAYEGIYNASLSVKLYFDHQMASATVNLPLGI